MNFTMIWSILLNMYIKLFVFSTIKCHPAVTIHLWLLGHMYESNPAVGFPDCREFVFSTRCWQVTFHQGHLIYAPIIRVLSPFHFHHHIVLPTFTFFQSAYFISIFTSLGLFHVFSIWQSVGLSLNLAHFLKMLFIEFGNLL